MIAETNCITADFVEAVWIQGHEGGIGIVIRFIENMEGWNQEINTPNPIPIPVPIPKS